MNRARRCVCLLVLAALPLTAQQQPAPTAAPSTAPITSAPATTPAAVTPAPINTTPPTSRAEQIQQQREETYRSPYTPDEDPLERAIIWARDRKLLDVFSGSFFNVSPTIGGMVNGSGISLGAQFLRQDLFGGQLKLRSSARFSVLGAQLYDFEVGAPRLANDRGYLDLYIRHRNYPRLRYYGPGPRSRRTGGTNYRLEDTQYDLSIGVKPVNWMRVGVTGGYLQVNVGPGTDSGYPSTERVYSPQQTPGIDRQTDFLRGGGVVQIDYRDNPYGPRSGGNYYARYDFYSDRDLGQYSFRRLTAEAQQFVPFFNRKRVIAGRIRTVLSYPDSGQRVPFYLQPTLGAADDLRGFRPFRFYDDNLLNMNAEYRWEILNGVDGALFADGGKVFPRPGLLNFSRLEGSFGAGLRFRATNFGAVISRIDLAFSREGFQIWFVFNDLFATPQIRTGRELSPPPGRLP